MSDEFYVGYLEQAPEKMGRWLKKWIIALLLLVAILAPAIVLTQRAFEPGTFEFGTYREFTGTLLHQPYPMLQVERPATSDSEATSHSLYYLVSFGKHGAREATRGLNNKRVMLEGSLIFRDHQTMIEIKEGSLEALGDGTSITDENLGQLTVTGEIVDSKCFLGVMKPGNLKPHKACAIRCIAGGVPPVFLVREEDGSAHYFLLVNEEQKSVNHEVLDMVAVPLKITGELIRRGDMLMLKADPKTYRRL